MFYRYEHYLSISQIAVSADGTYDYLVPELGHIVHDMVYDWVTMVPRRRSEKRLRTMRNLFQSGLFRRSKETEREKTQGRQKIRNKEKRPKTRRTNSPPSPPERKRRNVQHRKEMNKNSATPKERKKKKKRREKKRKKDATQLNSKKKKRPKTRRTNVTPIGMKKEKSPTPKREEKQCNSKRKKKA